MTEIREPLAQSVPRVALELPVLLAPLEVLVRLDPQAQLVGLEQLDLSDLLE